MLPVRRMRLFACEVCGEFGIFRKYISCLLCLLCLQGCYKVGPTRLDRDQSDYSRAFTSSGKQQTLLNVIRLRYADTPGFLDTMQVISGYQLQRSVSFGVGSSDVTRPYGGIGAQMQESPTFTFQPVTGDAYAQSILRPLPPENLLPLAMGGLPIDVLFRLAVQSVNLINNTTAMGREVGHGSPEFFHLIYDLRILQLSGLLGIQLERSLAKDVPQDRVFLSVASSDDPALERVAREARHFLGMTDDEERIEVVYGGGRPKKGQIRLLTRTILGVLGQIAYQIDVPAVDVTSGRTRPTISPIGRETKPIVTVHVGRKRPEDVFVWTTYNRKFYWVADDDFDSKLAFTMLQILLELSKTSKGTSAVLTIPVNG